MPSYPEGTTVLAPRFPLNILLIEDNHDDAELCLRTLRKAQFDIEADIVSTPNDVASRLRANAYDVILSDYNLGSWTGMDALNLLHENGRDIPFILVTGALGDQAAVECVKNGACDYILKDRMERLPVAIYHAMEERGLRNERRRTDQLLEESEIKYRTLADAIPVAVFIEQDTHFCYVNGAAERITGYSRPELLTMNYSRLIPVNAKNALADRLIDCLEGDRGPACEEAEIVTKEGERRWLDITVKSFQSRGKAAALIAGLDITDRKIPSGKN